MATHGERIADRAHGFNARGMQTNPTHAAHWREMQCGVIIINEVGFK